MIFYTPGRWWARRRFVSLIPSGCRLTPVHKSDVVGVPCKLLRIRHLTEIRVMVFTTLKMSKALIVSKIRFAHPVFGVSLETIMRVATITDTVSQT